MACERSPVQIRYGPQMKKRVFIIHGWDGYPEEGWFPWLKKELTKRGFAVEVPRMPKASEPTIGRWVSYLKKLVEQADENTYFVGHSIGCQTIIRYLASLTRDTEIGGGVFVAGWFTLMNQTEEEKRIAKPWFKTSINFKKAKRHTKKFLAIFSDNDDVVPLNNKIIFRKKLGTKTITQHNKGHFSGGDGIKKLPAALEAILKMSKN